MGQHHKWDLEQLENMMPWEREIYLGLLMEFIKKENERIEKENQKMRGQLNGRKDYQNG